MASGRTGPSKQSARCVGSRSVENSLKKCINDLQDLYAKCEGSLNVQSVVKAFVLGLLRQRTHQALADEKQLHLVGTRILLSVLSKHEIGPAG